MSEIRLPAERKYEAELKALAASDKGAKPPGWALSPRAVETYILGSDKPVGGMAITPKYVGDRSIVQVAIATLASDRALMLAGEPGTAKSWLSEHLSAAISGTSALVVQGTAGTSEEHIKYGWNYALLLAEGPSPKALVASPVLRAMHTDLTVRNMARAAMGRLAGVPLALDASSIDLRAALFNAHTKEERARAAERLADAGDVGAIPLLRLSFAGDISSEVRDASGRALGRLGDAESVDTFCVALAEREQDHERAKTSAYALGYLGDIRGLDALVAAYEDAWLPNVIAESIAAIGPAAIPVLLEVVEQRPQLLKRSTASTVFDELRPEALLPALIERVEAIAQASDFVPRATALMDMVKDRSPLNRQLGAKILELRPDLVARDAGREARALARKAGATSH